MNTLMKITNEFEGRPLTTITYKGKPCWIAAEIGRVLGYSANGSRLVGKIDESWSAELSEGKDYTVLVDSELADFKKVLDALPESGIGSRSAQVMLLFESGLHFVCLKTNKPIGISTRKIQNK